MSKTSKDRNKQLVEDDRWKVKGGAHRSPLPAPEVCPSCGGVGRVKDMLHKTIIRPCDTCEGTGEIWK